MARFSKALLGSAAAVAVASGAIAFSTSQASAQISINLGGLGGLIPHGNYGSRYHSRRGKTQHEVHHERRSKDREEAKGDDSGKNDSADDGDQGSSKSNHVQLSGHGPQAPASNPPSSNASAPSAPPPATQASGDVPSFTPEK